MRIVVVFGGIPIPGKIVKSPVAPTAPAGSDVGSPRFTRDACASAPALSDPSPAAAGIAGAGSTATGLSDGRASTGAT